MNRDIPAGLAAEHNDRLSEADAEVLKLTDAEIRERTSGFCYDFKSFESRMNSSEPGQQTIQAQLYIDHILTKILEEALEEPSAIDLNRMSFHQKSGLAAAMGLIRGELRNAINLINRLRNRIAHDLDFSIDASAVSAILSSLPAHARAVVREAACGAPPNMGQIAPVIVILLELRRQDLAFIRLRGERERVRLEVAIRKSGVGRPRTAVSERK